MVLKKTNSRFNSGTTQRFSGNGGYSKRQSSGPDDHTLSITLEGIPRVFDQENPPIEHVNTLNKIYEYLGFPGPSVDSFYMSSPGVFSYCRALGRTFLLNKKAFWLIPERINNLMKEDDFLEGYGPVADIHVHKIYRHAHYSKEYKKKSCFLRPKTETELLESDIKNQLDDKMKSKVRQKTRGLQRPHSLHNRQRQKMTKDDGKDEHLKKVVVELKEKDTLDARLLSIPRTYNDPMWARKSTKKSRFKSKSWVNGRYSELKGYTLMDIKDDEEEEMISRDANPNIWFNGDVDVNNFECEEISNEFHYKQFYDIDDCIVHNKRKNGKTRLNKKRQKKERIPALDEFRINPASSQYTTRHLKGSFQLIDRPDVPKETSDHDLMDDDDFVHISMDAFLGSDTELAFYQVQDKEMDQEKQALLEREVFESCDQFVDIDLQLDYDVDEMLASATFDAKRHTLTLGVWECPVFLANCYPPVICVKLKSTMFSEDFEWNLIVMSHLDVPSNKELQWQVTLKNCKQSDLNDIVREQFFDSLSTKDGDCISVDALVETALQSIQTATRATGEDHITKSAFTKSNSVNRSSGFNDNNSCLVKVLSMDNALKELDMLEKEKDVFIDDENVISIMPDNGDGITVPCEKVECDICFSSCDKYGHKDGGAIFLLPCRHVFCSECWKTHVFHSVIKGSGEIKCMHTNCNGVFNDAMTEFWISEKYRDKLSLRRKERRVDMSQFCQWCPRKTCKKVAIISHHESSMRTFGFPVTCECNSSWCFACQAEPHWPASCEQNAAYRKILIKEGIDLSLENDVDFAVDVKPCPGCKYPIEKNDGCPNMVCGMCEMSFCWKCLQSTENHRVFQCHVDENSNFVRYHLRNKIINNFPLKFFQISLEFRKKQLHLKKMNLQGWIDGLEIVNPKFLKIPFYISVHPTNVCIIKEKAISLAKEIFVFLTETYAFLEYFYLLLSFALLNTSNRQRDKSLVHFEMTTNILQFMLLRLEELIVGKTVRQIIRAEHRHSYQVYLSNGRQTFARLKKRVKRLRLLSQDVPTEWIGQLDPKKYYRYK